MNMKFAKIYILSLLLLFSTPVWAAPKSVVSECVKQSIAQTLTRIVQREVKGVPVKVTSVALRGGKVVVNTSVGMSYYPVREDNLAAIYDSVRLCLPKSLISKQIEIISEEHPLDFYHNMLHLRDQIPHKAPSRLSQASFHYILH